MLVLQRVKAEIWFDVYVEEGESAAATLHDALCAQAENPDIATLPRMFDWIVSEPEQED